MRPREWRGTYVESGWCEEAANDRLPWLVRLRAYAMCKSKRDRLHVPFGPGDLARDLNIDRALLTRTIDRAAKAGLLDPRSIPRCLLLPHTFARVAGGEDGQVPGEFCKYADEHREAGARRLRADYKPKQKRPAPKIGTKFVPNEESGEEAE